MTGEDFIISSTREETYIIGVEAGSLITEKILQDLPVQDGKKWQDTEKDILKMAIVERHGKNGNIGRCFVKGFGIKNGALAATVAHDSHNICTVGSSDEDMALAVNTLIEMQGGLTVVQQGKVLGRLPLPIAGLLSDYSCQEFNKELEKLMEAASATGCTLQDPFQQLSFLALPVIPHLKLTDKGLFDVDSFSCISEE